MYITNRVQPSHGHQMNWQSGVDNLRIQANWIGGKHFESAATDKRALILNIVHVATLPLNCTKKQNCWYLELADT